METSTRSTPRSPTHAATSATSSTVRPPSSQSLAENRARTGLWCGQVARTASTTSRRKRARFRREPPYASVRWFESGERNSWMRYPCAAWTSTTSKPASSARVAAAPKAVAIRAISPVGSSRGSS